MLGDFNVIRSLDDKCSGTTSWSGWQNDLNNCVIQSCLEDLIFTGSRFTWTNRQSNNTILKKLDWVLFFFGKLTYVLKEEDTNIIRGIPQIYNDNRNIEQQMATG